MRMIVYAQKQKILFLVVQCIKFVWYACFAAQVSFGAKVINNGRRE